MGAAAAVSRAGWWRRLAPLAALGILLETLFVSPAPWPLATTDPEPPGLLASLPGPGGVVDWPPEGTIQNRLYTMWQVEHGRPIPYGLNTFLPEPLLKDPLVVDLLGTLGDLDIRAKNRDVPRRVQIGRPNPSAATALPSWDLKWLVLHRAALSDTARARTEAVLERRLGPPTLEVDGDAAWSLEGNPGLVQ